MSTRLPNGNSLYAFDSDTEEEAKARLNKAITLVNSRLAEGKPYR